VKPTTIALGVAAVLFGYWAYKKYATLVNLQFVPRGINLTGNGFTVALGVQNTASDTLQYNSFAGTLYVNGSAVGNVSDFNSKLIAANAETGIAFNVSLNLFNLGSQLLTQLTGGNAGIQSARLTGVANISGGQYNVDVTLV
jgi:LEA14-like dessication related protein